MINQRVFVSWLPVAIGATLILGTIYAVVQQNYRQNANDPQMQMVEDGASYLEQGISPERMAGGLARIDIRKSLNTFAIFFGEDGKFLVSSGTFGTSSIPAVPSGVVESARTMDINKVTWQVPTGERYAAVVKHWGNANSTSSPSGFILVARSLREIENREFQLELIVATAWVITMVLTLIAAWFKVLYDRKYLKRE